MFDEQTVKDWTASLITHNADTTGLPIEDRITWVIEWTLVWYMMETGYGK